MLKDLTEEEMVGGHIMKPYCGRAFTPGSSYGQLFLAKKNRCNGWEGPLLGISPWLFFTVHHWDNVVHITFCTQCLNSSELWPHFHLCSAYRTQALLMSSHLKFSSSYSHLTLLCRVITILWVRDHWKTES